MMLLNSTTVPLRFMNSPVTKVPFSINTFIVEREIEKQQQFYSDDPT